MLCARSAIVERLAELRYAFPVVCGPTGQKVIFEPGRSDTPPTVTQM